MTPDPFSVPVSSPQYDRAVGWGQAAVVPTPCLSHMFSHTRPAMRHYLSVLGSSSSLLDSTEPNISDHCFFGGRVNLSRIRSAVK
jgi:hypothetical protein